MQTHLPLLLFYTIFCGSVFSHKADQAAEVTDKTGTRDRRGDNTMYERNVDATKNQKQSRDEAEGRTADAPEQNPFRKIFYMGLIHLYLFLQSAFLPDSFLPGSDGRLKLSAWRHFFLIH